jgi:hypothetical protein
MPRRNDRARPPADGPLLEEPLCRLLDQPAEGNLPRRRDPKAAEHLETLRVTLGRKKPELFVRLEQPTGRPPRLRVTNPDGAQATEYIHHQAGSSVGGLGDWVWEWAQLIGPVSDPEGSADNVLATLGIRGRRM